MPKPKQEINPSIVRNLASIMATQGEIAGVLGMTRRNFEIRLSKEKELRDAWEEGKANASITIRREQWKLLSKGNVAMAIFLGKNYCGQSDTVDHTVRGDARNPIEVRHDARAKLTSFLDRLASRMGEGEVAQQADAGSD